MEDEQYYKLLVQRFADRTATDEELEVFIKLANEGKLDAYLTEAMNKDAGITEEDETNFPAPKKVRPLWHRIAAAASVVLILSAGVYFLLKPKPNGQLTATIQQDLKPGTNGAILTLANGQKVILEQAKVGAITAGVQKSNDSLLVYNHAEAIGYNTLETPKGRQYAVVLPDGSKVWLNAASSLRYPTHFDKERLVELTGEAYFEVVHNAEHPFKVKTSNQIVEDIGTHFNINSYADEASTKTTLLEGAVRVSTANTQKLLSPGQQTVLANNQLLVQKADLDMETAWKNGDITLDADIPTIMRQVARWYNVEVVYTGKIGHEELFGSISRNKTLKEILTALTSSSNVHFKLEGRTVTVTP